MNGYKIIHEFLGNRENTSIRNERLSKPFIYLYHGLPITLLDKVKKEGLKTSYMGKYLKSEIDKNVLFFTSSIKYATWYSKNKMPLFHRSKWLVLKCKLNTKYLEFFIGPNILDKSDEYMYFRDVPARDIEFIID